MRFLDQEIFKDLSDKEVRTEVECKLKSLLEKVQQDPVNSIGKLWLYEHNIVSRISLEFIIYTASQSLLPRIFKQWLHDTSKHGLVFLDVQTPPSCTGRERERTMDCN